MAVLKRIAPGSAAKVGLVVYGFVGLILGAFCSVIAIAGMELIPHARLPFGRGIGMFAIVLCPIVYGIMGGIGAAIAAAIYNLAASWVGGVEVDIG
ncbi:MAG: hypothetical protein LAO06_19725 [Acidobacteriia bacterium]|nr:hypothetical protein [Terriglobia bacterium]